MLAPQNRQSTRNSTALAGPPPSPPRSGREGQRRLQCFQIFPAFQACAQLRLDLGGTGTVGPHALGAGAIVVRLAHARGELALLGLERADLRRQRAQLTALLERQLSARGGSWRRRRVGLRLR